MLYVDGVNVVPVYGNDAISGPVALKQVDVVVARAIVGVPETTETAVEGSEGQPLAVLEGMASRRPFVSTDVGSCRELLYGSNDDFGQAGIIVSMMDFEDMAKAIVTLVEDKKLRLEMGEAGCRRINESYTLNGFLDAYRKVYQEEYLDGK